MCGGDGPQDGYGPGYRVCKQELELELYVATVSHRVNYC